MEPLVGSPGPLRPTPLWAVPLCATLGPRGPPWALAGPALMGPALLGPMGVCGPSWAVVGRALVGRALVAPPGRSWAGPSWDTHVCMYTYI